MPIFMDRHDMRGATAGNVAEAHRKDLEICTLSAWQLEWGKLPRRGHLGIGPELFAHFRPLF
jgi:hypothetical protein